MSEPREPTFGEAMEQLEAILRRVEGEEIDIDELARELQRAARLLELARGKIRRAETEVSQILQTLERVQGDDGPEGESGPGEDLPS
jgi:exodeoxyribonuclease VII small subunit